MNEEIKITFVSYDRKIEIPVTDAIILRVEKDGRIIDHCITVKGIKEFILSKIRD